MKFSKMTIHLAVGLITIGLMGFCSSVAEAKYVQPDAIEIVQKIAQEKEKMAKVNNNSMLAAEMSEVMERLMTIAAEKYGIIFIVKGDSRKLLFSPKL